MQCNQSVRVEKVAIKIEPLPGQRRSHLPAVGLGLHQNQVKGEVHPIEIPRQTPQAKAVYFPPRTLELFDLGFGDPPASQICEILRGEQSLEWPIIAP